MIRHGDASAGQRPRRRSTGLTLVEVLASLVILTMVAIACVPLLRQAQRLTEPEPSGVDVVELADFARLALAEPDRFGLEAPDKLASHELQWPDHPERPPVIVSALRCDDESIRRVWLVFTCSSQSVARWVSLPELEKSKS